MYEYKLVKFDEVGKTCDEISVIAWYFTSILHPETGKGGPATIKHPETEVASVAAGVQEHLFMIASDGLDAITILFKLKDYVENFPTTWATIDGIAEQVQVVGLLEANTLVQQSTEGQGTAMNIGNDETAVSHGSFLYHQCLPV
jgi:hypothetical protein